MKRTHMTIYLYVFCFSYFAKIRVPQGVSSTDESTVEFLMQDPASAYYCGIVTGRALVSVFL